MSLEAARLVLQSPKAQQVIYAILIVLDMPVKHGGIGAQPEIVRDAGRLQPLAAIDLVIANNVAHAIANISAPPPGRKSTPAPSSF